MDLIELGRTLRQRREDIGVPRAVLAQRIGVSSTYMWMIERAAPRKNGEPSQPSKELVERWAAALGLSALAVAEALALAGHVSPTTRTARRSLLTFGGFSFPDIANAPETILEELQLLLKDGRLSPSEQAALLENLKSIIALLRDRYPRSSHR